MKLLLGMLLLASFNLSAKEVCIVQQTLMEDFSFRCTDTKDEQIIRRIYGNKTTGKKNDLLMVKKMLEGGYQIQAMSDSSDSGTTTWVFVRDN